MNDVLGLLAVFAVVLLIVKVIIPKLGIAP